MKTTTLNQFISDELNGQSIKVYATDEGFRAVPDTQISPLPDGVFCGNYYLGASAGDFGNSTCDEILDRAREAGYDWNNEQVSIDAL